MSMMWVLCFSSVVLDLNPFYGKSLGTVSTKSTYLFDYSLLIVYEGT